MAAKAGKASKAPLASTAQAKSEAASTSESEAKPAVDYPDWVAGLTKPGKTLGELRRTSEDDRTMVDVRHAMLVHTSSGLCVDVLQQSTSAVVAMLTCMCWRVCTMLVCMHATDAYSQLYQSASLVVGKLAPVLQNVRFEKLRQRASIKSRNFSKAKGV